MENFSNKGPTKMISKVATAKRQPNGGNTIKP